MVSEELISTLTTTGIILLKALAILFVGWIIAKIIQKIVRKVFIKAKWLTKLIDGNNKQSTSERTVVANSISKGVYYLIMIFVLILFLTALNLGNALDPIKDLLSKILLSIPNILGAIVILLVASFIGKILKTIVTLFLSKVGLDKLPKKIGLNIFDKGVKLSNLCGQLLFILIMIIATIQALEILSFTKLSALLVGLINFVFTDVLLAIIVLGVGFYLGNIAQKTIMKTKIDDKIALVAKFAIIILASFMALTQLGVGEEIVILAFSLTLGSIAIASAIAFGIGGRNVAEDYLKKVTKNKK